MASFFLSNSVSASLTLPPAAQPARASFCSSHVPSAPAIRFSGSDQARRCRRGLMFVTRAGPGMNSYLFAFAVPLSLLAVTIFASIKIADKLDDDFLEEVALNQAIREAEEDEDEAEISLEEIVQEPVLPRTRNRPKREA